MTTEQILNKAIYIQFPRWGKYFSYDNTNLNIHKLNIPDNEETYRYMTYKNNEHHYKLEYVINYVLPYLGNLLNFDFNITDFNIKTVQDTSNDNIIDILYLVPVNNYHYIVTNLETGIEFNGTSEILSFNSSYSTNLSLYHKLYVFSHLCSKIINLDLHNGKKLLISGDSLLIPSIVPLCSYFEEIWYLDNRTGKNGRIIEKESSKSFKELYKDVNFTDVLIELYASPIEQYTEINLM